MDIAMDLQVYLACLVVLIFTILLSLYVMKSKKPADFPPGPRGWPIIGNLDILNFERPQETYMKLAEKYGPVFTFHMGPEKIVILAGYETVRDALVNHADVFGERARVKLYHKMDKGMGIVYSQGENWEAMRKFTLSNLYDDTIGKSTIEEKIADECFHLTNVLASFKGKPFNNTVLLNACTANIIVSILLGSRMDYDDQKFLRLMTLINENVRLSRSKMVTLYNIFPFLGLFPGRHQKVLQNIKALSEFITKMVADHLKNWDVNNRRSFIDVFFLTQTQEAGNPHSYFHNDNLIGIVRNLLTAGMATTSTTLRWGLLLMIKYPIVQEMIQEEISRIIGSAQPLYSHQESMPFTNAIINEIQRFADVLPLNLPHETTKDVIFKGYFIPKGTFVIPLLSSVLRDKTRFEKPDVFYPNHFRSACGNLKMNEAFMPFSAGRRACFGEMLAKEEHFMFFTSLLQKFTFCLPPEVEDVDLSFVVGITNAPKQQLICAIPR